MTIIFVTYNMNSMGTFQNLTVMIFRNDQVKSKSLENLGNRKIEIK